MKRSFKLVAVAISLLGAVAYAGITGTKHDMTYWISADPTGPLGTAPTDQVCKYCHTPHNSDPSMLDVPLWNHVTTTSSFQPYTSTTMDATVGQPRGISLACLSCHDGTVAVDSYLGHTAGTFDIGARPGNLGTDLRNDHPISFEYSDTMITNDGYLHPRVNDNCMKVDVSGKCLIPLYGYNGTPRQVECASCHAVHDNTVGKFERIPNTGSALCLTCHNK